MSSGCAATCNDGKSDTEGIGESDLENGTVAWVEVIKEERGLGGYARVDVEEHACSFSDHFAEPAWTRMFEVELALRYRFALYDMS